jgi:hypothetical protein
MTLAQKLDRLPPCVCRLLAQRNTSLLTDTELCALTGWSREKVWRISAAKSWKGILVRDVDRFLMACGLSWSTQRRQLWVLKKAIERGPEGIRQMKHLIGPVAQKASRVTRLLKRTEKILRNQ